MATQQRKRSDKQANSNVKAKRKRNTKRGESSKREGFPGRRVPSGTLGNDQRDVLDAVTERTSKMVTQPSTTRTRNMTAEERKRVRNIDQVLANKVQLHN